MAGVVQDLETASLRSTDQGARKRRVIRKGYMPVQYHAKSVSVSQIISKREVTVACDTDDVRIAIHMSDRIAADLLLKLQELSLPRPDNDVPHLS